MTLIKNNSMALQTIAGILTQAAWYYEGTMSSHMEFESADKAITILEIHTFSIADILPCIERYEDDIEQFYSFEAIAEFIADPVAQKILLRSENLETITFKAIFPEF